jgi:uncharacterized protein YciI
MENMKLLFTFIVFTLLPLGVLGQNTNPNYDPDLATKLGADDYGMKEYVLVILKTGSNQTEDETFIDSCFAGHFENMSRMAKEDILIVAGPIGKNDMTYRGIFILNLSTIEEAAKVLQTDPAVHAKLLDAELYKWYGSAALPEYLEASDKIWKIEP